MTSTISTHAPTRPPRRPPTPGVRKVPCRTTDRKELPGSGRVLHPTTISSLDEYRAAGGLVGLQAAAERHSSEIIEAILDAGLRGRGGAGFPTGRKWQTVAANALSTSPSTVVVNGAEGEPGTFKDRSILRRNPYQVIEGAFVAARAVHADRVIIALKRSFAGEVARTRAALDEMRAAKVLPETIPCSVFEGPDEYLYGEETALLETIDGRGPFPRVVPPFRVGLRGHDPWRPVSDGPALVNNVETIANVPQIVARGARWFDAVGTPGSAGTVVCTVTGQLQRDDVGEFPMGTPLRHVLDRLGGGPVPGAPVKAVLSGVANPVILGDQLDVPVSHEGMKSIGCGLGSAGFMVFAEPTDMVAVAAGVARFLSIESCGQCTPCKTDGDDAVRTARPPRRLQRDGGRPRRDRTPHQHRRLWRAVQPGDPTRDRAGEHPRPLPRRVRSPPPPRRAGSRSHLHRRARRRLRRSGPRRRPPSAQAARLDVRTATLGSDSCRPPSPIPGGLTALTGLPMAGR